MSLLNFLPEMGLLISLFVSLVVINFRALTYRSLSLWVGGFSLACLAYFLARPDIAYPSAPLRMIYSDSLSYFGKLLALGSLTVFSCGIHFHRKLTFQAKQKASLFLVFYALFAIGLLQANHLVFFAACALGAYFSAMNIVLIESDQPSLGIKVFRGRVMSLGFYVALNGLLFAVGCFLFSSVYLSDWWIGLPQYSGGEFALFTLGFLILLTGIIPIAGLRYPGTAPLGTAVLAFGLFTAVAGFFFRVGIPFFGQSSLLAREPAQVLLSLCLGGFALRYTWRMIRTRDPLQWYGCSLPASVALALFVVLLKGDQALPAFYCISIALLFTFALSSHAFLGDKYRHKGLLLVAIVALVGAPPLILGEQYYRLIRDSVSSGNWVAGVLMITAWFAFSVAGMQMLGKILLMRNVPNTQRKLFSSEVFFIGIYLLCVIALTALRPELVSLLNEHPALNLW